MIYIYKVNIDDENEPLLVDTWNNKFEISSKKMDRDEVINTYNNGYYFTSEKKIEKISISKSELSKAVNVGAESGEPGFAFIPQVYDNKKLEDETAKDMESWLKDIQKDLEKELDKFYSGI